MNASVIMEGEKLEKLIRETAKNELREDECSKKQALEQFRDWITKNPDLRNCRTDDSFLLRFLRVKKFSLPMAEELLVKYINLRQNFPKIMYNLDLKDTQLEEVLSLGYCFVSPYRDDSGRSVIIVNVGAVDTKRYHWSVGIKLFHLNYAALLESEATQVAGVTYICGAENVTAAHLTNAPPGELFPFCKEVENALPLRHKEIHMLRLPSIGNLFYKAYKSIYSGKMQSRFHAHSSLEELHTMVNPKCLPKEYGGEMPMAQMIDLWKKEILSHREKILAIDDIKVVGDSCKGRRNLLDMGEYDMTGSFRKLEVD